MNLMWRTTLKHSVEVTDIFQMVFHYQWNVTMKQKYTLSCFYTRCLKGKKANYQINNIFFKYQTSRVPQKLVECHLSLFEPIPKDKDTLWFCIQSSLLFRHVACPIVSRFSSSRMSCPSAVSLWRG